jgi:hypothetical protein
MSRMKTKNLDIGSGLFSLTTSLKEGILIMGLKAPGFQEQTQNKIV